MDLKNYDVHNQSLVHMGFWCVFGLLSRFVNHLGWGVGWGVGPSLRGEVAYCWVVNKCQTASQKRMSDGFLNIELGWGTL